MLGVKAGKRFAEVIIDIITETAMSYPMILLEEEVFFTYDVIKNGEERVLCPQEIFRRNLQSNEIQRASFAEVFKEEELALCLSQGMKPSLLRGLEAIEAEEELLDCYEQIWQSYYITEEDELLVCQRRWKELFESLIPRSALYQLYLLVGKEMFEKELMR